MSEKIILNIIPNGPIQVSGFDSIKFCGETIKSGEPAFLCRCGNSKNPPFCDGSHQASEFSGENETKDKQGISTWEGKTLRTHFNANICMHARNCHPLDELRKKELKGDSNAAKAIAKVVTTCPSGALSYEMIDGPNEVDYESSGEVEIIQGGEIRLKCEVEANGLDAQEQQPKNRTTLCRCGLSKNKPFCDASHYHKEKFK
jgi:CDGSH-type Zn-finger protein